MSHKDHQDDEHRGQGGSYVVENGKRVLAERTIGPEDPRHPKNPAYKPETPKQKGKE